MNTIVERKNVICKNLLNYEECVKDGGKKLCLQLS